MLKIFIYVYVFALTSYFTVAQASADQCIQIPERVDTYDRKITTYFPVNQSEIIEDSSKPLIQMDFFTGYTIYSDKVVVFFEYVLSQGAANSNLKDVSLEFWNGEKYQLRYSDHIEIVIPRAEGGQFCGLDQTKGVEIVDKDGARLASSHLYLPIER